MTVDYRIGDCVEVMKEFPANHFDACCTDPPYGLEFMGKEWDKLWDGREHGGTPNPYIGIDGAHRQHGRGRPGPTYIAGKSAQVWHQVWATELLRVLKPGAHALVFGGTRTHHRLMCAMEDAGFEIRDCLMWIYGSGFPKTLDVSKAIDKAAGAERERSFVSENPANRPGNYGSGVLGETSETSTGWCKPVRPPITAPATKAAKKWSGWGTAIKPAYEPIILARKPLEGTVAANVLKYGTGGLNIDAARIGMSEADRERAKVPMGEWTRSGTTAATEKRDGRVFQPANGRWPANVILSHSPSCKLRGTKSVGGGNRRTAQPGTSKPFDDTRGLHEHSMTREGQAAPEAYGTETIEDWSCVPDCPVRDRK